MNHLTLSSPVRQVIEPHNATLITPRGVRLTVNITPEAVAVWTRYGFTVEWFAAGKKVAA